MNKQDWTYKTFGDIMSPARVMRCGERKLPVLSITMRNGIVEQNERFSKSIASIDKSNYKVVKNGQLVIAFPIDEGLLYTQDIVSEGIMSPAYNIWDVDYSCINRHFLVTYFHSPFAFAYYKAKLKGTTQRRRSMDKSDLLSMPIPVPPLGEQERIVEELDLLSGIIEKKKEQLKAYDQLAQSIFYTMFGDPIDNPKGWETKKLGEVCEYAKTRISSNDISVRNYIGVENLLQNCQGKTIASKVPKDIGLTMFIEGDVLIGNIRPYLKKIWLANCQGGCNGDVLAIRRKTQFATIVDVLYLFKCLSNDLFFEFAMQYSKGEKMPRGDKKEIMKYDLLLPPLSLQQEFAEKVESIERQKALIRQSIDEVQTMFDYTMDKYFG